MSLLSGLLLAADLAAALAAGFHVLLNKRDPRAIIGWLAICLLTPFVGAAMYYLFGINRVQTRARRLAARSPFAAGDDLKHRNQPTLLDPELRVLAGIAGSITEHPLLAGNQVDCLHDGEQAYPAMLDAIGASQRQVYLATYIFDTQGTGETFIGALADAAHRGIDVRVLVDGVGELSSLPRASQRLRQAGVRVERFIPPRLLPPQLSINLRNHRKILVVDGRLAFTGGMNISNDHLAGNIANRNRITDLHFRLQGPVIGPMMQTFLEDWGFVTGEREPVPVLDHQQAGLAFCRAITDGPNEDMEKLLQVLTAVISAARRRIGVMTPYFLPPGELLGALRAAAQRGVQVSLLLPGAIDHPSINWGAQHILDLLLEAGVRIGYRPAPFAHSKLLLVDDAYTLLGSANLDPRSLRLNFEFGVEVYDRALSEALWVHFESVRSRCRPLTVAELRGRSLPIKLRDALAWSCSPYL